MANLKIMATTRTTKAAVVDLDPTRGCIPIRQDTATARMDTHNIHTKNPSIISLQPLGRAEATLMLGAIRQTPVLWIVRSTNCPSSYNMDSKGSTLNPISMAMRQRLQSPPYIASTKHRPSILTLGALSAAPQQPRQRPTAVNCENRWTCPIQGTSERAGSSASLARIKAYVGGYLVLVRYSSNVCHDCSQWAFFSSSDMGKQGNCVFAFLLMLMLLIFFIRLSYGLYVYAWRCHDTWMPERIIKID